MKANLTACVRKHVYSAFHFIATLEILVIYFMMNNTRTFLCEMAFVHFLCPRSEMLHVCKISITISKLIIAVSEERA